MPSVRGGIENAKPEDAGNYANALSTFSQQVAQGGKSYMVVQDALEKENYEKANVILTQFQDNTSPVKDLNSLLSNIDKKIKELEKVEIDQTTQLP